MIDMTRSCNGATFQFLKCSKMTLADRDKPLEATVVPLVLTDFQMPLYSVHISLSVLGLDGVAVAHQLHELSRQDTVLEERSTLLHFQHSNQSACVCRSVFIRSTTIKTNLCSLHPNIYRYVFSIFLSFLDFNA